MAETLRYIVEVDSKGRPKIQALNKDLKGLQSQSKRTGAGITSLKSSLGALAAPLAKAVSGIAALRASFGALQAYTAFDDTMRQVGAVSNATAGELARLTDLAKQMGTETRYSSQQAAEGLKFLGMAGLDVNQQISALPGVLNLATAGAMDLGAAADIATNILTGYGLQVEDLGMVNDILAKTFTSSNTSLQELGYAFTYAGAVAKSSGQEFTEVAATLGLLANAGFKGEMGGTALRGAITKLLSPTRQAGEIISRLGVQITDSSGKMRPFLDIVNDLGESGASTADLMEVFGQRSGPGVAALIQQGEAAVNKMRATVEDYGGTTDRIAKQMESGIGGQLRALKSAFEALKISTGEAIAQALLDDVQELTEYLRENKDELKDFATALAEGVATIVKGGVALTDFIVKNKGLVEAVLLVTAGYKAYNVALVAGNVVTGILTGSTVALGAAMRATLAGAILYTTVQVYKFVEAFSEARKAQEMARESIRNSDAAQTRYQQKLASASAAAGRTISDWREIHAAAKAGEIAWDEASKSFVKGSGQQQDAVDSSANAVADWEDKLVALQGKNTEVYQTLPKVSGDALKEMQGQWDDLAKKIKEYDKAVEDTTRATGNMLFEMSLKGKAPIDSWNAQRAAAGRLSAEIKGLIAEGNALAQAGKLDAAEESWKKAATLGKELQGVYKSLGSEVKAEWTPAMEAAHKTAEEGVKRYGEQAKNWLTDVETHYKRVQSITDQLADRQLNLADRIRNIERAGMGAADAYQDMVSQAKEYESAANAALAAGDYDKAVELADRAASAWGNLGNEVKDGERVIVSANQALSAQADGVKSAGELAIKALEAKKAAEEEAGKKAEEMAKKAEAAKAAEAAKVAELEKQKSEVIKSESEANAVAMQGVAEAGNLITESQRAMADAARAASDELNKQSGFQLGDVYTEAGEQAKRLNELQETHNQLVQDTAIDWGNVWDAMQNGASDAFDAVDAEIQATEAKLEELTRDRTVKITIKEVTGASSGSSVGVSGASTGASVGRLGQYPILNGRYGKSLFGFGGGDTLKNLYALENGEQVVNKNSVKKFGGWEFAQAYNDGDEIRVANALFKQFPALAVNIPAIPKIDNRASIENNTVYKTTIIDNEHGQEYDRLYNNKTGMDMDLKREERFKRLMSRLKR